MDGVLDFETTNFPFGAFKINFKRYTDPETEEVVEYDIDEIFTVAAA